MSGQKGNTSGILRHGVMKAKYNVGLELLVLSVPYFKEERSAFACGAQWQCSEVNLNLTFPWHLWGSYSAWSSQQSRWCLSLLGAALMCDTMSPGSWDQPVTIPTETRFSPQICVLRYHSSVNHRVRGEESWPLYLSTSICQHLAHILPSCIIWGKLGFRNSSRWLIESS